MGRAEAVAKFGTVVGPRSVILGIDPHFAMTLPETMRVLGQRSFGGVEVLEELTMPLPPAEGADLLVRMEAVGINPVDAKVRSNWGGFGEFQCGQPVT